MKYGVAKDPVLHHMLDKTYRIAATPLTARKQQVGGFTPGTSQRDQKTSQWEIDSSPPSSPAPQLRADIFSSPLKKTPRTPGVSVQRTSGKGKQTYDATQTMRIFDSDSEEDEDEDKLGFSPPKTMQFHIPQSRLLQTPGKPPSACCSSNY
jgi:DASH complex subunit ASK1